MATIKQFLILALNCWSTSAEVANKSNEILFIISRLNSAPLRENFKKQWLYFMSVPKLRVSCRSLGEIFRPFHKTIFKIEILIWVLPFIRRAKSAYFNFVINDNNNVTLRGSWQSLATYHIAFTLQTSKVHYCVYNSPPLDITKIHTNPD